MQITTSVDEHGVALITLDDDGKNVLGHEAIAGILDALSSVDDAVALVLAGRPGVFSAGLDLAYVKEHGAAGARELILALGEVAVAIWTDPRSTACAATGHAIAGGTILAMAHDHIVAAAGHFKWGLTETRVNLEVPELGLEMARSRVAPKDINTYVLPGTPVDAAMAVAMGYADELAELEDAVPRALAVAAERAQLPAAAYGANKARLRGDAAARIVAGIEQDVLAVTRHLDA